MATVLIVIHLMVVLALIGLVLLQRSEGGALGIGGSGGVMSGRGAGNVLTRTTGVLAGVFFLTSIGLTLLARVESQPSDILDRLPAGSAPVQAPAPQAPIGAPESAQDLLESLGGPQAPPAPGPSAEVPAPPASGAVPAVPAPEPAAPAPAAPQPAPGTTP